MATAVPFIVAGAQLYSGYQQGKAQKRAADAQKMAGEANARISEFQAEDAIRRGAQETNILRRQIRGLLGKQTVGYAAQGIDVSTGSAADVLQDTQTLGQLDELTIKMNARREAYGHKLQAKAYRSGAQVAQQIGAAQSKATYLTSGLQAFQTLYGGL